MLEEEEQATMTPVESLQITNFSEAIASGEASVNSINFGEYLSLNGQ